MNSEENKPFAESGTDSTLTDVKVVGNFENGDYQKEKNANQDLQVSSEPPDGGWGWVVVISTTLMLIIISTLLNSFSILMHEYNHTFQVGYGRLGLVMGANMLALHFTSALCPHFVERYGCRPVAMIGFAVAGIMVFIASFADRISTLALLYAIAGCGLGLSYLSCFVCVQQYFTSKRALASGITMTGFSISSLVIPLFTKWLLSMYTWRGTLVVIAALHIQAISLASLLKPLAKNSPKNTETTHSKQMDIAKDIKQFFKKMFPMELLKNKRYIAYCFGTMASNLGLLTFLSHTPELTRTLLKHNGIVDDYISSSMLTAYGLTSCLFRCTSGVIGSYLPIDRVALCAFGIIMGGLTTCTMGFFNSHNSILIICIFVGIFSGIFAGVQITALADMMGVQRIARCAGLLQIFNGVAGIFAIPFSGALRDISGAYVLPYMVMGIVETLGGVLIMCIPAYRLYKYRSNSNNP